MSTIGIRPARVDELRATTDVRFEMVLEIDGENLDESYAGWRDRHVAFYAAGIAADRAAIFLAEDEGGVVGITAVYKLDNHRSAIYEQPSAYIANVYVAPASRRRGIAAALTRRAIEWARERGCVVIRLRTTGTGRALYESLGFERTNERELRLDCPGGRTGRATRRRADE